MKSTKPGLMGQLVQGVVVSGNGRTMEMEMEMGERCQNLRRMLHSPIQLVANWLAVAIPPLTTYTPQRFND